MAIISSAIPCWCGSNRLQRGTIEQSQAAMTGQRVASVQKKDRSIAAFHAECSAAEHVVDDTT